VSLLTTDRASTSTLRSTPDTGFVDHSLRENAVAANLHNIRILRKTGRFGQPVVSFQSFIGQQFPNTSAFTRFAGERGGKKRRPSLYQ
jgi:hypothetical protein